MFLIKLQWKVDNDLYEKKLLPTDIDSRSVTKKYIVIMGLKNSLKIISCDTREITPKFIWTTSPFFPKKSIIFLYQRRVDPIKVN